MPLMQAKKNMIMAVLYEVPPKRTDVEWLMRQPLLLNCFHEALTAMPESAEQLTGLALFARLCVAETPESEFLPFYLP